MYKRQELDHEKQGFGGPRLDADGYERHLGDVLVGVLTAPTSDLVT